MANAATATYAGRSLIWAFVKAAGSPTEPKNIGWGDPASTLTASANADVALFKPQTEARVAGTSSLTTTSYLADTYQVTGTITATNAKTITEAGLFDTTTAASTSIIATTSQSAAATTITLSATIGPASGNFYIQVENEVELVTAGQGAATLTVVRGQLGLDIDGTCHRCNGNIRRGWIGEYQRIARRTDGNICQHDGEGRDVVCACRFCGNCICQ